MKSLFFSSSLALLLWQTLSFQMLADLDEPEIKSPTFSEFRVVLDPRHQATLSAEIASSVKEIAKEMGDYFQAGDLLIRLDETVFRAKHKRAKFMLERAQEQLAAKKQLFEDNVASSFELKAAQADLAQAELELTTATKDLQACFIKAPYEGHLQKVLTNKHEVVQIGQPLIEVVQDRTLLAKLLVPSEYYDQIKIGKSLRLHLKETSMQVDAIVTHIGAVIDPASSMIQIFAEVDNYEGKLRAGMTGTTKLEKNHE